MWRKAIFESEADMAEYASGRPRIGVSTAKCWKNHARLAKLTPGEFEVFRLVIGGLLNKEIGAKQSVTLRTIRLRPIAPA
jgi:DNA-binding NarL/FixJ family response regulator